MAQFHYDVFLSYSHAAGGKLAPQLQRGLEQLLKPWYRLKGFSVFRDQTNLGLHPDLWGQIETELARARFLLLLLSPEAAASKWVNRELEWWLRNRNRNSVLLALTSGELVWDDASRRFDARRSTSLPAALSTTYPNEPHWLDLRWTAAEQGLDGRHVRFRSALIDLAATVRGVTPGALEGDALRILRQNRIWAAAGAASLALALAGAMFLGWKAENARILGEARLLQSTAPTESFLVLQALSERWFADEDVIQYLPAQVLLAPLSTLRHDLSDSASGIALGPNGSHALAVQDGSAIVWASAAQQDGVTLPARRVSTEAEKTAYDGGKVPLSKAGFVLNGTKLATLDWRGCLRVMGFADSDRGGLDRDSQECVNRAGDSYTAAGWDAVGNLWWIEDRALRILAGGRVWRQSLPGAAAVQGVAIASDSSGVLVRFEDQTAVRLDLAGGRVHPLGADVVEVGNCLDGAAWVLRSGGQLETTPSSPSTRLAGKGPWKLSPNCALYIDGAGDVYSARGQTTPIARGPADGWRANGNMVQVAFSNDNKKVAVSALDGRILVHDLDTGAVLSALGHNSRIFDLQFSPEGDSLWSTSFDRSVRRFDLRGGLALPEKAPNGARSIYPGPERPVFSGAPYIAADLPDSAADQDQTIQPLDAGGAKPPPVRVRQDWKLNGAYLLFDTETDMSVLVCAAYKCFGKPTRSFRADAATQPATARSSGNARYIAAVDASGQVRLFDVGRLDGQPVLHLSFKDSITALDATFDTQSSRLVILRNQEVFSVPLTLNELAKVVRSRVRYCLATQERETYLGEWAWVARWRKAACDRQLS